MTEDGFAVRETSDRVEMVITGRWSHDARLAFEANAVDRLVLNYALGFDAPNLEFLRALPVKELVVLDRKVRDLEPVYSLGNTLRSLQLTIDPATTVDLRRLPNLRSVAVEWSQVAESLAGLSTHQNLTRLEVAMASRLADLSELKYLGAIEFLQLERCGRIHDLGDLSVCRAIHTLNISDCGDISTLQPLKDLTRLRVLYAYGTTKVLDGDLSPIANLPRLEELRMQDRREYRPRVSEIQARISRE
jgi:hypothetical protein